MSIFRTDAFYLDCSFDHNNFISGKRLNAKNYYLLKVGNIEKFTFVYYFIDQFDRFFEKKLASVLWQHYTQLVSIDFCPV